ncbi:hypothetical protein BpHYR1_008651 [Brachionus plicatilis]|uniref:Uncharacterized protein n=1 Tax=Brachionus plicatilis TaxID=10195 RepID=A0A3M7TAB8_BRAPC|nr:hypothetical protein BpHYR1_008651 [Brachionus plicatilis]
MYAVSIIVNFFNSQANVFLALVETIYQIRFFTCKDLMREIQHNKTKHKIVFLDIHIENKT